MLETLQTRSKDSWSEEGKPAEHRPLLWWQSGYFVWCKKKTLKPSFKEKRLQPHLSEKPFEDKAVALTVSENIFNLKI